MCMATLLKGDDDDDDDDNDNNNNNIVYITIIWNIKIVVEIQRSWNGKNDSVTNNAMVNWNHLRKYLSNIPGQNAV